MTNNVGICACPLCGVESDVRVNKNYNLYTMCANSHQTKFNSFESKKALAALHRQEIIITGIITLKPLKDERIQDEQTERGIKSIKSGANLSGKDIRSNAGQPDDGKDNGDTGGGYTWF